MSTLKEIPIDIDLPSVLDPDPNESDGMYTHYDYDFNTMLETENNPDPTETDTSGYITESDRVQQFIDSGQILTQYREAFYDSEEEESAEPSGDSTRVPNFDLADASIKSRQIQAEFRSKILVENARKKSASEDASKTPQVESEGTKVESEKEET